MSIFQLAYPRAFTYLLNQVMAFDRYVDSHLLWEVGIE